jgi:hypothetical protein
MNLTNEELIKWLCLFECIDEVSKYCVNKKLNTEHVLNKKMKQHHIREYIKDRSHSMSNDFDTGRIAIRKGFAHDFVYGKGN